jgi:transcriptional regulator with XRE-family HTH domain
MRLIAQRRDRLGMSKRAAASLAGLSESRWRQLEDGGREVGGTWITEQATDKALARMAHAVRLKPDDVKSFSVRAALLLADLIEEYEAVGRQDAEDAARMVDVLGSAMTGRKRAALEAEVAESLRRMREE